jgi:hypothetical protein
MIGVNMCEVLMVLYPSDRTHSAVTRLLLLAGPKLVNGAPRLLESVSAHRSWICGCQFSGQLTRGVDGCIVHVARVRYRCLQTIST